MSDWFIPLQDLTPEQRRVVELPPTEHRLIRGGPGSGKTLVLLHRAHFLIREKGMDPARICILVYTNVLRDYIRAALPYLGIPSENVSTYDRWAAALYRSIMGREGPLLGLEPDYTRTRLELVDQLRYQRAHLCAYDAILVDEGGDLHPQAYEIMRRVGLHITVAIDRKQQLYSYGASEEQIIKELSGSFDRARHSNFLETYRCSPYITKIAAAFMPPSPEQRQFSTQTRQPQREREKPLLTECATLSEEEDRVAAVLRDRQLNGDRVAVLVRTHRRAQQLRKAMKERGVEVELQRAQQTLISELNFRSELPKVLTYHSAKGLTFDSVILPYLDLQEEPRDHLCGARNLMFVAITRATKWVFFSTQDLARTPGRELFEALAASGDLVMRRRGEAARRTERVVRAVEHAEFL